MSRIDTHAFGLWWKLAKGWFSTKFSSISVDLTPVEDKLDDVKEAVENIDIDTSDLAKEATLGDVSEVLDYIEQGGVPSITAIAKQGSNANATLSNTQAAVKDGNDTTIGMLKDQTNGLAAIKAAASAGGGTVYPTVQMTATTAAIDPNKVYIWGEVASLDVSLNAGEQGVANVYFLEFYSGATATTLTLPASVISVRGSISSNSIINVAIFNNIAYVA